MKYQILQHTNPDELTKQVQKALDDGWKPQGSLCFQAMPMQTQTLTGVQTGVVCVFAQAIVHYEGK